MISIESANHLLFILTVIGDFLIVGFFIFIISKIVFKKKINISWIAKRALLFAFIISLIATLGSLFYSEIAGYVPCKLCWFQRVFMYPLVLILGVALVRKFKNIFYYVLPMTATGAVISGYHYFLQRAEYTASCSAGGVSCTSRYVFHYGYVTIPIMALTAFILIMIALYLWKNSTDKK